MESGTLLVIAGMIGLYFKVEYSWWIIFCGLVYLFTRE